MRIDNAELAEVLQEKSIFRTDVEQQRFNEKFNDLRELSLSSYVRVTLPDGADGADGADNATYFRPMGVQGNELYRPPAEPRTRLVDPRCCLCSLEPPSSPAAATATTPAVCAARVCRTFHVLGSYRLTCPVLRAAASTSPRGENASEYTRSDSYGMLRNSSPVEGSQATILPPESTADS